MQRILALGARAHVVILGLAGCGTASKAEPKAAPSPSAVASTAVASAGKSAGTSASVPQRVRQTLARIDSGTWPPDDGSGTQGGRNFGNFEGLLPKTGSNGSKVKYTEWDVNIKKRGSGRDAERIITGSDGSAWFTLDHYKSFTRIR